MESISKEGEPVLPSLFSFSHWKKATTDPKIRRIELALIFSIGLLFGIVMKDLATRSITIGYEDYTVQTPKNRIDFNITERKVLSKGGSSFGLGSPENGEVCSQ